MTPDQKAELDKFNAAVAYVRQHGEHRDTNAKMGYVHLDSWWFDGWHVSASTNGGWLLNHTTRLWAYLESGEDGMPVKYSFGDKSLIPVFV